MTHAYSELIVKVGHKQRHFLLYIYVPIIIYAMYMTTNRPLFARVISTVCPKTTVVSCHLVQGHRLVHHTSPKPHEPHLNEHFLIRKAHADEGIESHSNLIWCVALCGILVLCWTMSWFIRFGVT